MKTKEDHIKKIKEAQDKYYKESPCLHCGPGNGCDDCRGCEDAKKNYDLQKVLREALDEYEKTYGISYQCEELIKSTEEAEIKWLDIRQKCTECGKSLASGCLECNRYSALINSLSKFKYLKEDLERQYHIQYEDYKNKQDNNIKNSKVMIMTDEQKRDLIIDSGVTIKQWIDYNINKYGAQNFFDCVNNSWDDKMIESIKQSLLEEIKTKIKPRNIETIDDLANLLDGNEYGDELRNEYNLNVEEICKKNNWVVVFGYSDDNLELRGAIDDEIGAWEGITIKLVKPGDFYLVDEYEETYQKAKETMFTSIEDSEFEELKKDNYKGTCVIECLWCPEDSDASWQFNCAGAPSIRFNIMEEEELYAECLVIDLNCLING